MIADNGSMQNIYKIPSTYIIIKNFESVNINIEIFQIFYKNNYFQ